MDVQNDKMEAKNDKGMIRMTEWKAWNDKVGAE